MRSSLDNKIDASTIYFPIFTIDINIAIRHIAISILKGEKSSKAFLLKVDEQFVEFLDSYIIFYLRSSYNYNVVKKHYLSLLLILRKKFDKIELAEADIKNRVIEVIEIYSNSFQHISEEMIENERGEKNLISLSESKDNLHNINKVYPKKLKSINFDLNAEGIRDIVYLDRATEDIKHYVKELSNIYQNPLHEYEHIEGLDQVVTYLKSINEDGRDKVKVFIRSLLKELVKCLTEELQTTELESAHKLKAENKYEEAIASYEKVGITAPVLPEMAIIALDAIGDIHFEQGKIVEAEKYYGRALEVRETKFRKNSAELASSYLKFADMYFGIRQYVKALEYQKKAMKIFDEAKALKECAGVCSKMASIYQIQDNYEEALKYAERTVNFAKECNVDNLDEYYQKLAVINYYVGQEEEAKEYTNNITSRAYAFRSKFLSDEGIESYIGSFLEDIDGLIGFLKTNQGLWEIAHIPSSLETICRIYLNIQLPKEEFTVTDVYEAITVKIMEDYKKSRVIKDFRLVQEALEKLAYLSMLGEVSKKELLDQGVAEEVLSQLLETKIVRISVSVSEAKVSFVDPMIQKYYAASYICNLFKNEDKRKEREDLLDNHLLTQELEKVWWFVAGTLYNNSEESKNTAELDRFWDSVVNTVDRLKKKGELVKEYKYLAIKLLDESKADKSVRSLRYIVNARIKRIHDHYDSLFVDEKLNKSLLISPYMAQLVVEKYIADLKFLPIKIPYILDKWKIETIRKIGRVGRAAKKAIPELIKMLNGGNKDVRMQIIETLKLIGIAAIPALTAALGSELVALRLGVIEALGLIGLAIAIPSLVEVLRNNGEEEMVKQFALEALDRIDTEEARKAMENYRIKILNEAAKSGNIERIKVIISKSIKDSRTIYLSITTAINIAIENKHAEIVEYLSSFIKTQEFETYLAKPTPVQMSI